MIKLFTKNYVYVISVSYKVRLAVRISSSGLPLSAPLHTTDIVIVVLIVVVHVTIVEIHVPCIGGGILITRPL